MKKNLLMKKYGILKLFKVNLFDIYENPLKKLHKNKGIFELSLKDYKIKNLKFKK